MNQRTRVVIVRGHQVTPWELRPWERLPERFDVGVVESRGNRFETGSLALDRVPVRTLAGPLQRRLPLVASRDRYVGLAGALRGADIVHSEELSYWFSAAAARAKEEAGFRLVQTVWETLPLLSAYRNPKARRNREAVLAHTDVFLAATERAREALLLEGVGEERVAVCPPGIDVGRFTAAAAPASEHVVLSPGRLVWEKGHQDVLRAVAAIHRGLVEAPAKPRVLLVGSGPEEGRLRAYASELGLDGFVDFRSVPYDEMPGVYASASCMVLASLASAGCELPPLSGRHRCFWEEQFGFVLAEALASGLPIAASSSGAIPEVVDGSAELFTPGDWMGLARILAAGPLSRPPAERVQHPAELVRRYSTEAAAERLAAAYDGVIARR